MAPPMRVAICAKGINCMRFATVRIGNVADALAAVAHVDNGHLNLVHVEKPTHESAGGHQCRHRTDYHASKVVIERPRVRGLNGKELPLEN